MTRDEARRVLERTSTFELRGDMVAVRSVRLLDSIDRARTDAREAAAFVHAPLRSALVRRAA